MKTVRTFIALKWLLFTQEQLMVTHRKPHKPASIDSVATWLKQVLSFSGILEHLVIVEHNKDFGLRAMGMQTYTRAVTTS